MWKMPNTRKLRTKSNREEEIPELRLLRRYFYLVSKRWFMNQNLTSVKQAGTWKLGSGVLMGCQDR